MSMLNNAMRNAIKSAINAGVRLNQNLAASLANTTDKQRDTFFWECADLVAECYTSHAGHHIKVVAYASRKGNAITFSSIAEDGKYIRTPASNAARFWFSRNILNAGFVTLTKDAPSKSKAERLAAQYERLNAKEQREFLRLLGI